MATRDYVFHTTPLAHQLKDFLEHAELPAWGLFHEQGTGKSKIAIDTAAHLYLQGKIDGVVVVCPSSVKTTWAKEQIPTHLPRRVLDESMTYVLQVGKIRAAKVKTKAGGKRKHAIIFDALCGHRGLSWLIMNYESFRYQHPKDALWQFLQRRRVLYILDESSNIQNNRALQTKAILKSARYAHYRRIMDGTPVANAPDDVYPQICFLDPDFWRQRGLGSPSAFRGEFSDYRPHPSMRWVEFHGHRNLDKLQTWLKSISSRVLKKEVLDLPAKVYSSRRFMMSDEQQRLYDELCQTYVAQINGDEVVADHPLTRLLRLQQITCGYLPNTDDEEPVHALKDNPRLELLKECLGSTPDQVIIWARFRLDRQMICDLLGKSAVLFDGTCSSTEREQAREASKRGDAQYIVMAQKAGGTGLTLNEAGMEVYYSNTFSLREREQSEDRAHRIGQEKSVQVIDLVGEFTIDERILQAHRDKMDLATVVTGDVLKEWCAHEPE